MLTAHPTEARRRTLLVALRRIRRLLDLLDDPLVTPDEDADLRRRLREEISLLWHTGDIRSVMPTPLDEVRSELAIFDETLFTVVPGFERAIDRALDPGHDAPARRARAADAGRDRHPPGGRAGACSGSGRGSGRTATAIPASRATSRSTPPGSRPTTCCAATRPSRAGSCRRSPRASPTTTWTARSATRSPRTREELPETMRQLRRRFPEEPYRQRLGAIAERIRRTRAALTGETAPRTRAATRTRRRSTRSWPSSTRRSSADGLGRVAYGELADLRWQLGTFGFHLASLEVRQHAAVHRAALAALDAGAGPEVEAAGGAVTLGEVLATFRCDRAAPGALGGRAPASAT